jgi:hypothetical protein
MDHQSLVLSLEDLKSAKIQYKIVPDIRSHGPPRYEALREKCFLFYSCFGPFLVVSF